MLLPRRFAVLNIALLVALHANAQINPYFLCQPRTPTTQPYTIAFNQRNEIILNNCTSTVANEIMDRIYSSTLRGHPIILNLVPSDRITNVHLENSTHLDLTRNNVAEINLQNFTHLKYLNLTSNKFRSISTIKLPKNQTLSSIDLSRNRLLTLDGYSIPSTRRLYIRSNNIFELRNLTFPECLEELDLTRNEIENISTIRFSSNNLKILNLSINLINAVTTSTFEYLPSLEVLILECNKICDIHVSTFRNNSKLNELNLRDNNLSILKKAVFDDLVNLQILDVSKNHLLKLTPDTMQNLNNLVHFSLSENTKLCNSECKNDLEFLLVLGGRLKVLKMNRLRLKRFPVTLTTSIRHLDLSRNKLISVQLGDLENFPFLEVLMLSSNEIRDTEKDVFSRMEYLQELYLNDNQLLAVPSALPSTLKILLLNENRITSLRKIDFHNLSNLKVLKLNSNSIHDIENESFASCSILKTLDISRNPILQLNTDAFEGANKIETFYASRLLHVNMNVTDLRYFPISEMPNLRTLNLSHSPELVKSFLTDFPLLITVKQLEVLDLDYANLSHIPTYLEHFLPRLKFLTLIGNPLNCSGDFIDWKESSSLDLHTINNNSSQMRIRVTRQFIEAPLSGRVFIRSPCLFHTTPSINISIVEFWKMLQPTKKMHHSYEDIQCISCTTTSDPMSSYLRPQAKRNKLNSRSLNQRISNFLVTSVGNQSIESQFPSALISVMSLFNDTMRYEFEKAFSSGLTDGEIRRKIDQIITSSNEGLSYGSRTIKLPFSQLRINPKSTIMQESSTDSTNVETASQRRYEALVRNRSDERLSFFDWFPSFNESRADHVGRILATDDIVVEYTHPGIIIFLIISSLLLLTFLSLVVPSCIHNYKWRKRRYKTSEFDNECQRSIEISSISAFVETEILIE